MSRAHKGIAKPFICSGCGVVFLAISKRAKDGQPHCSHECYLDHRYGLNRPKKVKSTPIFILQCLTCGVWNVFRRYNQSRCKPCQYLWQIETSADRVHRLREPARKAGDRITRKQLHARDGGRCYMCGIKTTLTNTKKKRPKNLSTIDHVVPLSKGGAHTWANVRNCCWRCNITKSNKILLNYQSLLDLDYV